MCRMAGDMSLVTCATWTASDPLSSSKSSSPPLRVIPEHDMDTGLGLALGWNGCDHIRPPLTQHASEIPLLTP